VACSTIPGVAYQQDPLPDQQQCGLKGTNHHLGDLVAVAFNQGALQDNGVTDVVNMWPDARKTHTAVL
jgi:hypothetical protein